jgi:hypothetical protein
MEAETELSTPVETSDVDTSANIEPETVETDTDTSITEPTDVEAAETETEAGVTDSDVQKLYAGKYKSVEELEKGYEETQKFVYKANEFEKKYNELLERQQKEYEQAQAERLHQAQTRGFNSVEQQEISDKVTLMEFEYYANNLNALHPDVMEQVRSNLLQYYQTGHKGYLDEAKRYYPSDFIEQVALAKSQTESKLRNEYEAKRQYEQDATTQKLAETLKADFAEFLTDIANNEGKAQALKSFCDVGSINSKEDMQIFTEIYGKIAAYEREQAIKELEAQKAIEETKNKAVIDSGATNLPTDGGKLTYEQVKRMSQSEFDSAVDKYGLEAVINAN